MPGRLSKSVTLTVSAILLTSNIASASQDCSVDAMIVFDGSGSMAEMGFNGLDQPRIIEAQAAMHGSIPSIAKQRNLGLIVYGAGDNEICTNINLKLSPNANAAPAILAAIDNVTPFGNTPLTESVLKAAEVLQYKEKPGEIVLVTDGKETCGGEPCKLASELSAANAALTVHVIGFQVRGEYFAWENEAAHEQYIKSTTIAKCLADITGGLYFAAENASELEQAMHKTLGCAAIGSLRQRYYGPSPS